MLKAKLGNFKGVKTTIGTNILTTSMDTSKASKTTTNNIKTNTDFTGPLMITHGSSRDGTSNETEENIKTTLASSKATDLTTSSNYEIHSMNKYKSYFKFVTLYKSTFLKIYIRDRLTKQYINSNYVAGESSGNGGVVAGAIVGLLVVVAIIVALVLVLRKKKLAKNDQVSKSGSANEVTYKPKGMDDSVQMTQDRNKSL